MKKNSIKNKIIFITPSFTKGGAEKNILNIINALESKDFDITLIICTNETRYIQLLNKKITIIVLNRTGVLNSIIPLFKQLKKIKPNIVFTSALHLVPPLILLKILCLNRFLKITRIPTLPSNKLERNNIKSKLLNLINNIAISQSDLVIAQTEEMKIEIEDYYQVAEHKIKVIPNLVDIQTILNKSKEPVQYEKKGFTYLASGSLYSVKGFDLLIQAFHQHLQKYPSSYLIILGSESVEKGYKKFLEELIVQLKCTENIRLLGHQDNPYKYYNISDVFVLSSIKEGFPNVVLENLVLNKPVLVTNCVNYGNLIHSNNGIIIQKNSIEALKNGLEQIRFMNQTESSLSNFDYNNWLKTISK